MDIYKSIHLVHGDGGKHTFKLIKDVFYKNFSNDILLQGTDSASIKLEDKDISFTTDSFVINPLFFRGGDIGKLCVCGTVNDLLVSGARPLYLSLSFIIEEGFSIELLKKISESISNTCSKANVKIVTGDTKVVERGKVDKIFINTSGIGVRDGYKPKKIQKGDQIIATGTIGEHGAAIAVDRYDLDVKGNISSDCASLSYILEILKDYKDGIKFMTDPTRGGIGEVLNEISDKADLGIHIYKENIPIREEVKSVSSILGLNPLYLASEGRALIVVDKYIAKEIKNKLNKVYNCVNASIIGHFTDSVNYVYLENNFGGKRIINSLDVHMLPRIC